MAQYLSPDDLVDPLMVTITAVEMRKVDGWHRIVLYFEGETRGLLLSREQALDMTEAYGPHPIVERYLAMN